MTNEFDAKVLEVFLAKQSRLFPEPVAETPEAAEAFLEECMAVVADGVQEVLDYFEEEGVDTEDAGADEIIEADEVFDIGDGRYLIVEA